MTGRVIFLVRHGETEWNRVRRYQGWLDSPLTTRGIAQAAAIGRRLRTIPEAATAAIVASPIGRARRTAELIQAELPEAGTIAYDDRLREISLGTWDGLDYREIDARAPEIFAGAESRWEWYFHTPGGETYDGFAGRVSEWLDAAEKRILIVVTHGVVTRVLRGLYAGLPRAAALRLPVPQDRFYRLADGRIDEIAL
jgi:broad specificity phosphatase PhoE